MRVVLFFDQIQAGAGGKERPDVPLAVEKGGIGAYLTFAPYLTGKEKTVVATTYCGTHYFQENKTEVCRKLLGLFKKVKADVVLCGPCYNYPDFAKMSCELASLVEKHLPDCKAIVMCSKENKTLIDHYKEELVILPMPKKGGVGLSDSFKKLSIVMDNLSNTKDFASVQEYRY